jgi:phosphatidylglycerophosphatase A
MKWVASLGGIGFLPGPAGTWGSLVSLPLAWGAHSLGGPVFLLNLTVFAFLTGYIATGRATADTEPDPGWVVIDELVGQWIALLPVSFGAAFAGVDILALWPGWVAAFVLFRLFDIWKPWLVGWADRRPGPLGVMLDDVIAGLFAAIGVSALAAFAHLVLL